MIEFMGEMVHRVLTFDVPQAPPDLTYRDEPIDTTPDGILVGFFGGPRHGMISCMPASCDEWVEPDGSVYS